MLIRSDETEQQKLPSDSSGSPKAIVRSPLLQARQRHFALATILVPFLGFIFAAGSVLLSGIGFMEAGLLSTMYALTVLGITVGFHRQLAHRAFQTGVTVRVMLAVLGSMAAQGPVIHWVSNHRRHHQYSDQPGDPHSPHLQPLGKSGQLYGLWHAHIGWMFGSELVNSALCARDLRRDPAIVRVSRLYLIWVMLGLAIPTILAGLLSQTWTGAWQGLLWGGLVRIFLVHHATWSINSIAHLWGSRPFETHEQSTNNFWLAIPTGGEGWHHNHHAFPSSAVFGLEWWQIDLGGWVIQGLEKLGLAWEVKRPTQLMVAAKKRLRLD